MTDQILHLDFLQVEATKPIVMEVPVVLTGHAEGVKAGGKLSLEMRKLKVRAPYNEIPEQLFIDVTELGLGKTIQVGALSFDGLEITNAKNAVVCAVKLTRAARGAMAKGAAKYVHGLFPYRRGRSLLRLGAASLPLLSLVNYPVTLR